MKKKGFTLLELMIAISIFAIVSGFIYKTFFSQIKQSVGFNNNIDIQYNVNKALNLLSAKLRNSNNITLSGSPTSQVLSGSRVIIDLSSNSSAPDIYYDALNRKLIDKDAGTVNNIITIEISQGISANKEIELIFITVSAVEGSTQFTSSTAINIRR